LDIQMGWSFSKIWFRVQHFQTFLQKRLNLNFNMSIGVCWFCQLCLNRYQFCDGTVGVCFNDGSRIVAHPKNGYFVLNHQLTHCSCFLQTKNKQRYQTNFWFWIL
jgi:hypothetical protein